MRLLLVADLHYALPQFDWVANVAPAFDIVVMAGDHLDMGSSVDGRAQSVVVQKYFAKLREKTRLLICSGNHDLDSHDAKGEKIAKWLTGARNDGIPSDGDAFVVDDTLFTICPWWDGPLTREGIAGQIAAAAEERLKTWIWVHHAPPDKSPISWGGNRYFGDAELVQWIEQYAPDIVLSGHVHQSPFVKEGSWVDRIGTTWVFNSGHQFGAPPAHIVIDTDAREAVWISAAGNQLVRLDEPLERPVPPLAGFPAWLTGGGPPPAPVPA